MGEHVEAKPRAFVLGENALIPIGIVASLLILVVSATWWLSGCISGFTRDITALTKEVTSLREDVVQRHIEIRNDFSARMLAIEAHIAEGAIDRFKGRDFDVWIRQFNAENREKGVVAPAREKD